MSAAADSTAADATARAEALDPTRSFIVEAPAGSGKTELLTQRLLRLLATVELPEQIVAITFTRKAAAEMRRRVVDTLRAAAEAERSAAAVAAAPEIPAHRQPSLELARAVLARSAERGWSLPEQCRRLRILTIDALNTSLARQLPVLTSGIVGLEVSDSADGLYRLAARRTTEALAESGPLGEGLRQLLGMADNSLRQLEHWLAGALPQRDRWLRLLRTAQASSLPEAVEAALNALERDQAARLRALAGSDRERRLFALLERRADGAEAAADDAATEGAAAPGAGPAAAEAGLAAARWREAARFLLTARGAWRRRFTRRDGVPPGATELRADLDALRAELAAVDGLEGALAALARLPGTTLDAGQREFMDALVPVLKRLLAELRIAFADSRCVDHTELALAAQQALGAVDAPSDLLLALDRRIEHILVDEFQDTSHLQWGLLERLTAGWEAGDGRTLFLVGDPMQSIYRFRDADLSLFLRARHEGLGEVRLRHLQLAMNYRSAPALVDWVNTVFTPVFAAATATVGASPPFSPSRSGQSAHPGAGADPQAGTDLQAGVELHATADGDRDDEIARVVAIVGRETAADPAGSIGILVRSRSHLIGLRAALAAAGLSAHAVEIDSLTDTQLGQDLITLTQALLHEGDRLAWLGLLRGPCCGLGWSDLHALCHDERKRTIRELLADPERLARLSAAGRERAGWLAARLETGFGLRAGLTLGQWLRSCWLLLDGPASLSGETELVTTEGYFHDLDRLARNADVDDPAQLRAWFSRPTGAEVPTESGVEIMTIHRAKGLEFDTVIVPGLARITRGNSSKLIFCNDFNLSNGSRMSVLAGAAGHADALGDFLRHSEREQEAAERARLLYVAATRAKRRLHLLGVPASTASPAGAAPRTGSLLATLWPGIEGMAAAAEPTAAPEEGGGPDEAFFELPLTRLRFDRDVPLPPIEGVLPGQTQTPRPEFEWVRPASVQVGTLIHRELQRLAGRAAAAGEPVAPVIETARYRRELALLGVEPEDLAAAAARVAEALETVWGDPVGRWILAPRTEAWSELRLTLRAPEGLRHLQLDRSFVDADGQRWIIDFKTGRHLGADVEGFLDAEVERYREQLEGYARAVATFDPRPLRVGLYFPLLAKFRDWTPVGLPGD